MMTGGRLWQGTKGSVKRRGLPALAAMLVMGAGAWGAHKTRKEEVHAARLNSAPASARSLKNPFAGSQVAALAGRRLFMRHCAECHGQDGYGIGRAANLHSAAVQSAPPGVLYWAIRNGRLPKGMPSWAGLPNQQIWQLITFVETLKDKTRK
jgi:mono/diheme cytochrome c family protein